MASGPATMLMVVFMMMGAVEGVAEARPTDDVTCAGRALLPEHLRTQNCALAALAAAGLERSTTFRDLVERIRTLDGIVYVMATRLLQPSDRRAPDGGLIHRVTRIGSRRALVVAVVPGMGDRSLGVMAHEFQHAIEVLSSQASNEADIDALYARIGTPAGGRLTETAAASAVERVVGRELAARRAPSSRHR